MQCLTCILRRVKRARACGAQRQRQLLHGAYHLGLHILRTLNMRVDDGHHVLVGNERHDGALKGDDAARHAGDGRRQRDLALTREVQDIREQLADVDGADVA